MTALKTIILAVPLTVLGCSSDTLVMPEKTEKRIGSQGGRTHSADGKLTLDFSQGALSAEHSITVETKRTKTDVPRLRSLVYELGPDGLQFSGQGVTITIAGLEDTGEELAIANVDGLYPQILESSTWDPGSGRVTATLPHFSAWAVVGVYNPCAGLGCGVSCTVCDPQDPTCMEPPPSGKACNRSGLCVDAQAPQCTPVSDAGSGMDASFDAGIAMDGGAPDSGVTGCLDTFTQNSQPVVDILLVIDNSCSMLEEQFTLGSSFDLLLDTLTQNNVDFHIGVTTVDIADQGILLGGPSIITSTTQNLAQAFAQNVALGSNGSGQEQGLETGRLALMPGRNPGFLRGTGSLAIVYVSDEDDQSPMTPHDYAADLLALGGPRRVQANVIIGEGPAGCSGSNGQAGYGARYDDVRYLTGGALDSICTAPYAQALTDLGGSGFGYLYQFTLSQPVTGVVASVAVNGLSVPSADWSYDSASNSVTFTEAAVPAPGATIEIISECR